MLLNILGGIVAVLAVLLAVLRGNNKQLKAEAKIEKIKFIQQEKENERLSNAHEVVSKVDTNVGSGSEGDAAKWLRDNANRDKD